MRLLQYALYVCFLPLWLATHCLVMDPVFVSNGIRNIYSYTIALGCYTIPFSSNTEIVYNIYYKFLYNLNVLKYVSIYNVLSVMICIISIFQFVIRYS